MTWIVDTATQIGLGITRVRWAPPDRVRDRAIRYYGYVPEVMENARKLRPYDDDITFDISDEAQRMFGNNQARLGELGPDALRFEYRPWIAEPPPVNFQFLEPYPPPERPGDIYEIANARIKAVMELALKGPGWAADNEPKSSLGGGRNDPNDPNREGCQR